MILPPEGSDPLRALPHRAPFLFVDRVEHRDDDSLVASWHVDGSEDFLRGHFPGMPVVPGVLIGESLAQASGLLLATRPDMAGRANAIGYLAKMDLRFHAGARPPVTIMLSTRRTGGFGSLHQFDVSASCGGTALASGMLVLSIPAADTDQPGLTPR